MTSNFRMKHYKYPEYDTYMSMLTIQAAFIEYVDNKNYKQQNDKPWEMADDKDGDDDDNDAGQIEFPVSAPTLMMADHSETRQQCITIDFGKKISKYERWSSNDFSEEVKIGRHHVLCKS